QYTRRARIAQSLALPPVADEPASPLRDGSQREACPTDSDFGADQDRATIAKTSTLPHDSVPRVTYPTADEGTQEMEINILKARVKLLEDRDEVATKRSGDDALIKGRNLDEGEAVSERVSDDIEEMAIVLTSIDAATVLACGAAEVPTGSGSIHTTGSPAAEVSTDSDVVPTASLISTTTTVVTPYRRRKAKEIMVESETPKKKKVQEQIDAQVARELEEQMAREDPRMFEQVAMDAKIQQRNPWSKKQKRDYYMAVIKSNLGWKVKDFKGMTFEEIEGKFTTVWKQFEDFIPMGLKKEAERLKRKGLSLEQESLKKLKTSEEVPKEAKSPDEVPEEKVKEMMELVPIEEVYVEALQVKHRIIDWKHMDREDLNQLWALVKESLNNMQPTIEWKLYDMCGVHQVTSKDKEIFMLMEKDYPLRKGLAIMMICYKLQVENHSQMANEQILKIYKIANYLSQQGRCCQSEYEYFYLGISPDVAKLKDIVKALLLDKKGQNQSLAPMKAVEESYVTCGGAHSYRNCPAIKGNVYRDNI
nr:hypothetical protein [Tanacetum cinerariifolium]